MFENFIKFISAGKFGILRTYMERVSSGIVRSFTSSFILFVSELGIDLDRSI